MPYLTVIKLQNPKWNCVDFNQKIPLKNDVINLRYRKDSINGKPAPKRNLNLPQGPANLQLFRLHFEDLSCRTGLYTCNPNSKPSRISPSAFNKHHKPSLKTSLQHIHMLHCHRQKQQGYVVSDTIIVHTPSIPPNKLRLEYWTDSFTAASPRLRIFSTIGPTWRSETRRASHPLKSNKTTGQDKDKRREWNKCAMGRMSNSMFTLKLSCHIQN